MFEDIHLVVAVDDRKDAREVEAAREYRRGAQQVLLGVGEEVVGPGDGVAERLLAIRAAGGPLQHPEAITETIPDLARAHRRHPRCGQLDAERETVERLADVDHRCGRLGVLQPEVGACRAGPVDEQRDCVRRHTALERERRHGQERLSGDPQVLARCGEDARRCQIGRGSR